LEGNFENISNEDQLEMRIIAEGIIKKRQNGCPPEVVEAKKRAVKLSKRRLMEIKR